MLHPLGTEKWLLGTAVFIAHVLTAEITACIASLLFTCRHFTSKQPAKCKGCNSLLVLAKNLQLTHLVKYRIFGVTDLRQIYHAKSFDCHVKIEDVIVKHSWPKSSKGAVCVMSLELFSLFVPNFIHSHLVAHTKCFTRIFFWVEKCIFVFTSG